MRLSLGDMAIIEAHAAGYRAGESPVLQDDVADILAVWQPEWFDDDGEMTDDANATFLACVQVETLRELGALTWH